MTVKKIDKLWQQFGRQYALNAHQLGQFKVYGHLLQEWNKKINLTAITQLEDIISYHFADALQLSRYVDFNAGDTVADIGTGGGIPGLPLKIMFPQLPMVLIEVNQKKITFLKEVIAQLELTNVQIVDLDWRTFLRKMERPIQIFLARASLQPEELIRIYKPSCPIYNEAKLIYWASSQWQPAGKLEPYIDKQTPYEVGSKKRQYVFFSDPKRP